MTEGIRIPIPAGADLMGPYPVKLPQFEGPLDLLLHLIRKNELDIRNLPLVDICRQYHEYLVLMQELDLEVAAEFLYVEAMLVHIKSQMVLPRATASTPEEDPRDELVRRLLEYRKYKGVAETLHEMEAVRLGLWSRAPAKLETPEGRRPRTPTFRKSRSSISSRSSRARWTATARSTRLSMEIEHQKFSIKEKMEQMLARVKSGDGPLPLSDVFRSLSGRAEAIAIFLAVLELLRLRVVKARQEGEFSEIYLDSTGEQTSLEGYEEAYR